MLPTALSYKELMRRLAVNDVYIAEDRGKGSEKILKSTRFPMKMHTIKGRENEDYDIRTIAAILRKFNIEKTRFWLDKRELKRLEKEGRKKQINIYSRFIAS